MKWRQFLKVVPAIRLPATYATGQKRSAFTTAVDSMLEVTLGPAYYETLSSDASASFQNGIAVMAAAEGHEALRRATRLALDECLTDLSDWHWPRVRYVHACVLASVHRSLLALFTVTEEVRDKLGPDVVLSMQCPCNADLRNSPGRVEVWLIVGA